MKQINDIMANLVVIDQFIFESALVRLDSLKPTNPSRYCQTQKTLKELLVIRKIESALKAQDFSLLQPIPECCFEAKQLTNYLVNSNPDILNVLNGDLDTKPVTDLDTKALITTLYCLMILGGAN